MLAHIILFSFPIRPRQVDRALALHESDYLTHRVLGRNRQQYVNMVGLEMPFHHCALLLLGQPLEHFTQMLAQFLVQLLAPVFGDKDNVLLARPFRVA